MRWMVPSTSSSRLYSKVCFKLAGGCQRCWKNVLASATWGMVLDAVRGGCLRAVGAALGDRVSDTEVRLVCVGVLLDLPVGGTPRVAWGRDASKLGLRGVI